MSREEVRNKLIELDLVQGQVSSKKNIADELKDLKNLFDSGSLTKEEYEKAKKVIKLITLNMEISVIIPVYNSSSIVALIENLEKNLIFVDDFEIILINDFSTDNSWEEIVKISKIIKK